MQATTYQRGIYDVYLYEKEDGVWTGQPVSGKEATSMKSVKIATFDDGMFALVDAETLQVKAEFTLEEWMLIPDSNFHRRNEGHVIGSKAVKYIDNLQLPLVRNG